MVLPAEEAKLFQNLVAVQGRLVAWLNSDTMRCYTLTSMRIFALSLYIYIYIIVNA